MLAGCQAPPEISNLAVVTQGFVAGIAFSAEDPNKDLDGGRVFVTLGEYSEDYALVSEDRSEERSGVIVALAFPYPACDAGQAVSVEVTVADGAGLESNEIATSVVLGGNVLLESEPNDTVADSFFYDGPDDGICGHIVSTGSSQNVYSGDVDIFDMQSSIAGIRTFVLRQPSTTFMDLWIDGQVTRASAGTVSGGFRLVTMEALVDTGGDTEIYIAADRGPSGQYSVTIE